jgi:hypothetical protein
MATWPNHCHIFVTNGESFRFRESAMQAEEKKARNSE